MAHTVSHSVPYAGLGEREINRDDTVLRLCFHSALLTYIVLLCYFFSDKLRLIDLSNSQLLRNSLMKSHFTLLRHIFWLGRHTSVTEV